MSNPTADALRAAGQRYREALREMAQGPGANPWAEPGLSVEERADELAKVHDVFATSWVMEAFRAVRADALEEAAKLAEDMAFDAVALRIRRLGGVS